MLEPRDEKMEAVIEALPGQKLRAQPAHRASLRRAHSRCAERGRVKVFGDELDVMLREAQRISGVLATIKLPWADGQATELY